MSTIKVKSGMFGRTLGEALRTSRIGDRILLAPGEYELDPTTVAGLTFEGSAQPEDVVLHTRFVVTGWATFMNLTLRSPHFSNVVNLSTPGTQAVLRGCIVESDPAGKYPAIYSQGGTVSLQHCEVRGAGKARTVLLEGNAQFTAENSSIGRLLSTGSRASLRRVSARFVSAGQRSRIEAADLELIPDPGQRILVLEGESVCDIGVLTTPDRAGEVMCEESSLRIGAVHIPEGTELLVISQGAGVVRTDSPAVRITDPDSPPEAKEVPWPLSSARAFTRVVQPHARAGDTVVLEEGTYYLDDIPGSLMLGLHLRGQGSGRTILHGCLGVFEDGEASVTGITLRARTVSNALQTGPGSTLAVEDVVIEKASDLDAPSIYLAPRSRTTMNDVRVIAPTDHVEGHMMLEGAQLEAGRSELGWLYAMEASTAKIIGCRALAVTASAASQVTGSLTFLGNDADALDLTVMEGATVDLHWADTDREDLEMLAQGADLRIHTMISPPASRIVVRDEADATVEVHGPGIVLQDEDSTARTAQSSTPVDPSPAAGVAPWEQGEESATEGSGLDAVGPAGSAEVTRASASTEPLDEILSLTGLAAVKEQIQGFTQMVRFNQIRAERRLRTTDISMHSSFLGNPGTGKTTVARLLGRILHQSGAISSDTFVEVGRGDLVSENIGGSAKKTAAVLESARGGVLFIDEAYSLYQTKNNEFAQEAVDTLIAFMENNRDSIVVIFAGYADRMHDFLQMNPGLQSRIANRFDFEDYTPEEIAQIGYRDLESNDYTVDQSRYGRTVATLYTRSADRSNGRWVRNLNEQLVKAMVGRVMKAPPSADEDLTHISEEDLRSIGGGSGEDSSRAVEALLMQLDAMVGLDPVKTWVRRLVNRVALDRERWELDGGTSRPTYHMVFSGNPGTGKTTVAAIVARLFHHLGVLATPQVKVVERSTLVGRWIGHTEQRTAAAVDEAMGGVLFIDEAYQLTKEGNENDFGKLAVETLMTRLENDRDRFVAIFAGYTDEMDTFLSANPGLRSRVPLTLEFPDYTPEEVARIVVDILSQTWDVDTELLADAAAEAYARVPERDRSNGRWARNFADRVEALHSDYVAEHGIRGEAVRRIDPEVIRAAAMS